MIDEKEAHSLLAELKGLQKIYNETQSKSDQHKLNKHENLCMEKFKYLVDMKVNRYKAFSNYEDLKQDGFEALLKAIKTFEPTKGSFFSWSHKYIGTRISRAANLHTAIRYPMKFSAETAPYRVSKMPTILDTQDLPDVAFASEEKLSGVREAMKNNLTPLQQQIVELAFGINSTAVNKPTMSSKKICQTLKINKLVYKENLQKAMEVLKYVIWLESEIELMEEEMMDGSV